MVKPFTVFTTLRAAACLAAATLPMGPGPGAAGTVATAVQAPGRSEIAVPGEETRRRRDRLVELLRAELEPGQSGVFLIAGARQSELGEFRQGSDFHYLTGVVAPGAVLVVAFDKESFTETLFLPPRDQEAEKWMGSTLDPGGIAAGASVPDEKRLWTALLTGMRGATDRPGTGVAGIPELGEALSALARPGVVLFLPEEAAEGEEPPLEDRYLEPLREPGLAVPERAASEALSRLRLVKSESELAAIRRAVEITCAGHRAAMRAMEPGLHEYEIEALIEYEFTRAGARFNAFPTIVGSGPNSCVLHYSTNERRILPGETVVVDAGAEFDRYAADVTRTLPSSGSFDAEQTRIYKAVLRAQREGLELVRPGSRIRDINEKVEAHLRDKGLDQYLVHGCCHFVGLDVHDRGDRDAILEPGMVLTVEPGLYLPDKGIGVRIEDTVLVTREGGEVLSACAPKDLEELKAEMDLGRGQRRISSSASADPRR